MSSCVILGVFALVLSLLFSSAVVLSSSVLVCVAFGFSAELTLRLGMDIFIFRNVKERVYNIGDLFCSFVDLLV